MEACSYILCKYLFLITSSVTTRKMYRNVRPSFGAVTRGLIVTSWTAINTLKSRHSNKVIKKGKVGFFPSFPGFLLVNNR
jgi:hypothetical protein